MNNVKKDQLVGFLKFAIDEIDDNDIKVELDKILDKVNDDQQLDDDDINYIVDNTFDKVNGPDFNDEDAKKDFVSKTCDEYNESLSNGLSNSDVENEDEEVAEEIDEIDRIEARIDEIAEIEKEFVSMNVDLLKNNIPSKIDGFNLSDSEKEEKKNKLASIDNGDSLNKFVNENFKNETKDELFIELLDNKINEIISEKQDLEKSFEISDDNLNKDSQYLVALGLANNLLAYSRDNQNSQEKRDELSRVASDLRINIRNGNIDLVKINELVSKYSIDKGELILNSYKLEVDSALKNIEQLTVKLQNKQQDIISTKDNRYNLETKLTTILRNQESLKIKINNLEDSIENNSLLPYAVKSILSNPKLIGIHNTIGKILEISEEYVKAIGTALGASSNNIIVENEQVAKEAINYLKSNALGRATFFPLNIIKGKIIDDEVYKNLKKEKGFIDIASLLVKYNPKYANIINNQLGNVLVVDSLDNANKLSKKLNYRYRIVTLEGELLHIGGSLTGGENKQKNPLTEKFELQKLLNDAKELEHTVATYENEINNFDNLLKALEDEAYLINKDKITLEEELKEKAKRIREIEEKIADVKFNISGTNNVLNNSLSNEEDNILKEYYKALDDKNKVMNQIEVLSNEKELVTNELESYEYSVKKDNSLYSQKLKELNTLEIEVNRSDVKLDNLLNLLSENYSITYEYAKTHYTLEIDSSLARNKVSSLKRQIKELGPINHEAPEEYERVSGRYEFLLQQQQDLIKAENTLLDIIQEMDQVMEFNFKKSFDVINENFDKTFKELFKGGTASLKMTDPDNILETGIEIIASPPGKNLKSISLLSGGEKTFTAISLLFAILKTRPMPFCILDEVEAALDEVNVESFGEYLKKMQDKTQFLVITHKKKTMEYADTLYGITMQESGVSKLVSVKLEELK